MVSEGPTTAGSIKGTLKLDASDWFEKLAAADAAARKLGGVDPTVRVDVDDNGAVTKLAAVDAAAKRLDGTNQRLNDSLANVNNTNAGGVQRWQLIAGAIAALIPLLPALTGYVVGVGGAFLGMGAAAGLALYGIIAQMRANTQLGEQYRQGIDRLKNSLDTLGATAAARMLTQFNIAVAMITTSLPQLNNQISVFTTFAGRLGSTLLQAVINALHVLNPLFVQGAEYVQQLADGFLAWTANGGLEKFTAYAMQVFPQVAATLGSLAGLAFHLVEGFSAWGGPMLTIIKAVADALNAIPAPLLTTFAFGAVAVVTAFRGWSQVKSAIDGVNGSLGQTKAAGTGAFAAIMQVAAAVDAMILQATAAASSGIKQWQGLTQGTDKWSAAIRNGNINVSNLGRTLGAVGGFWNDFANNIDIAGTSVRPLYDNVKALDQAMASATPEDLKRSYTQLVAEGKKVGKSQADIAALFPAATAAMHAQEQAAKAAAAGQQDNVNIVDALTKSTKNAKDALSQYNQALQGLGKTSLDESSAQIAYAQSVADATAAIKQNGATLDLNTQQGRDNQAALDKMASSAVTVIAAHQAAGKSTQELTADMAAARASFITTAEQMGMTADQANHLADQYGLVPKDVTTAFNTSGVAQAEADAARVKAAYDAITRLITVRVQTITANATNPNVGFGLGTGKRDGGTIGAADGQTVPAGGSPHRDSWNYMLASGEEIISNRFGQASQNRGLLKLVNSGANAMQVAGYVNQKAGAPTTQVIEKHYHAAITVLANDPNELAGKIAMKFNAMGAA